MHTHCRQRRSRPAPARATRFNRVQYCVPAGRHTTLHLWCVPNVKPCACGPVPHQAHSSLFVRRAATGRALPMPGRPAPRSVERGRHHRATSAQHRTEASAAGSPTLMHRPSPLPLPLTTIRPVPLPSSQAVAVHVLRLSIWHPVPWLTLPWNSAREHSRAPLAWYQEGPKRRRPLG